MNKKDRFKKIRILFGKNKKKILAPLILSGPVPIIGTLVAAGVFIYLFFKKK